MALPYFGTAALVSHLAFPTIKFIRAPAPGYDCTQISTSDGCPARDNAVAGARGGLMEGVKATPDNP